MNTRNSIFLKGVIKIKKNIFIALLVIGMVIFIIDFIDGTKAKVYDDIEIININSNNYLLENILKDNYLLIDSSFLEKSNEIDITLYNNSSKYNLYVTLDCENKDNYVIRTDINHLQVKSHEEKIGKIYIETIFKNDSDFIKCYLNMEKD